jgi:guanylate kinase
MSSSPASARGLLFVVSAPSGTGKTTVVERLVVSRPGLRQSRSYTSRPPRPGEREGVDYNFVTRAAFEEMIRRDELLEWADIFGHLYGTSRSDTEAALSAGVDLVLVIDVQGARQVRQRMPDAVGIFVLPPSFSALALRLRGRNQDPLADIERRLATARDEITAVDEYDYVVVNDDVERCVREVGSIVAAERARRWRRRPSIEPIMRTFEQSPVSAPSRPALEGE